MLTSAGSRRGRLGKMDAAALQGWTVVAVLAAWFSFAAIFVFRRRPTASAERTRDPMGTVGLVLQGVGFGLVWSIRRPTSVPILDTSFPVLVALAVLDVAIAAGSVTLTLWSVRHLGRQWALAARLVEGHQLVTGGPYRYVRNPIYTGMLGMLVATGLAVSRPLGLLLGVLVFSAGTVIRVRAEERLLRTAFGETWEAWARRTPALIPGIW
jgi:protein-S-isoprenylcysteine O-methyltransferase Ste14